MGASLAARAVGRPRCQGGEGEPALPKGHRQRDTRGVGSGTGLAEAVCSTSVTCEALPRGEGPQTFARPLPGESPGDVHQSSLLALLQVLLALLVLLALVLLLVVLALQLV